MRLNPELVHAILKSHSTRAVPSNTICLHDPEYARSFLRPLEMTPIENREDRYGTLAVLFHWSMAVLVMVLAAVGLYMASLPDAGFTTAKVRLVLCHKEFGVLVLVLVIARLAWRITQILPQLVEHLPDWQKVAARFVHLSLYALMFALPVTGWFMSSAAGIPVSFFGLVAEP